MFGSNREYLKQQQEKKKEQKDSIKVMKNILENAIMTINEIQDIQSIKIEEKQKDIMRNNIINTKRSEFVNKIIELDRLSKQF